jgi:hypothetical protein
VAKVCNAKILRGLPLLRQLDEWLIGSDYDYEFLQKHCAVTDEGGKILDLYIAMSEDSIRWADLENMTPFLDGLEDSWSYDTLVDGPYREIGGDAPSMRSTSLQKQKHSVSQPMGITAPSAAAKTPSTDPKIGRDTKRPTGHKNGRCAPYATPPTATNIPEAT